VPLSVSERFRTVKSWRAFWKKMALLSYAGANGKTVYYCDTDRDPSLSVSNTAPDARSEQWSDWEARKIVQTAWRHGYHGLAALVAAAWDSMLSPVDVRELTPSKVDWDDHGAFFQVGRAKTGRDAVATLSPWSVALMTAYGERIGGKLTLLPDTPIFWSRGFVPTGKGGRPRPPSPYTKDSLGRDFAVVRALAFGEADRRQLQDMRRSGAVEGDAGGATLTDQSNKMANTIAANARLRKTYNPVNVASARRFDEARKTGAKKLRLKEQNSTKSCTTPGLVQLFNADASK
jgi:hypothetical protein